MLRARGGGTANGVTNMTRTKRALRMALATAVIAGAVSVPAAAAFGGQPGPGDKQCVPGQQGNPHPGFKAGVC